MKDCFRYTHWLNLWNLIPDGSPFKTHTSLLLPVRTAKDDTQAMLKITQDSDEKRGSSLMAWWGGNGAAQVIAFDNEAILLVRATSSASLTNMSREGQDTEACRILCERANKLHKSPKKPLPQLTSLQEWFYPLKSAASRYGGSLVISSGYADELLETPQDVVALHGDLHHDNVLHFGTPG
ncbi:hypothetical protein SB00175_05010 [Klebsiella oxytoca]|nr:StrB [Klebsiella oxytoca]VGP57957.1 hypothetical protein SB00175_05010 [Klebsiella oxytoca]